jgi:predicted peptidase
VAFIAKSVDLAGVPESFQVWVPEQLEPPYPAVLFLHGRGESGDDNIAQLRIGLPKAVEEHPELWPFLIVCPQKRDHNVLWPSYLRVLDVILRQVEGDFSIDSTQCFLTGLSQGGNGALALVNRLRWRFAAVAALCGWADPQLAAFEFQDVPLWLFHGVKDSAVPCECSQAIERYLTLRNGHVRMSLYSEADHNCWDLAYTGRELTDWFLSHRRA